MSQDSARLFTTIYEHALDIIFPPRCAGCQLWSKEIFCPDCRADLTLICAPFCTICGLPFDPLAYSADECADCRANRYHKAPPYRVLRSAYTFEGTMRHAVHSFKYKDKVALASPLATLLHSFLKQQPTGAPSIPCNQLKLLIPVPLHPWRRYRRGYNQSALLARELSHQLNVPVAEVLCRTRHTTPQVELSARARAQNVSGAFTVDEGVVQQAYNSSGPVLLIDDVCTTGATLRECAETLKKSGLTEVYALTLARQL